MDSISVVITTLNEERNIQRCLDSVKKVADEVIVIDSFSNDRTEEICKQQAVSFIQRKWEGYALAKNYGNSLAKYPHILSLDADEVLSEKLSASILGLKANGFKADAYYFNRLTNYCGKWIHHSGWYPDRKIRLWKKEMGIWEGMIHEHLVLKENSRVYHLKGDLQHYSYYSIVEHANQINHFTDLMAEDNFKKGIKSTWGKLLINPLFRFFVSYIIRRGFMDGYYGFVICLMSSYATFLKYAKTREKWQKG